MDEYIDDAKELLDTLEAKLLLLEENKDDREAIEEVFRVMHNLKGSAGMYGFENVGLLTHDLESIYDRIRDKAMLLDKKILDITFKSVDVLKDLLEGKDVIPNEDSFNELLADIKAILGNNSTEKQHESEPSEEVSSQNNNLFFIILKPDENVFMRGVNMTSLLSEIESLGVFETKQIGDATPLEKQQESRQLKSKWEILLATKNTKSDIEDVFIFLQDDEFSIFELQVNQTDFSEIEKACSEIGGKCKEDSQLVKDFIEKNAVREKRKKTLSTGVKDVLRESKQKEETIRVGSGKLDVLINLVSELVTSKAHLDILAADINDNRLIKALESIDKLSKRFRDNALELRLIPIESIMTTFKRLVRDLSSSLNKPIDFVTEGSDTELDKTIISGLEKPIMHLVRNAADHGIEHPDVRKANNKPATGVIKFISFYSGANVFIQIQDDGAGIDKKVILKKAIEKGLVSPNEELTDKEIYNLIFAPGFSTAANVSDLSGRGVGMDVVRTAIEEMRGEIDISTEIGLGTSFTIKLPLTLSIIDTLQVRVDKTDFLIPLSDVELCENITTKKLTERSHETVELNEELIPYLFLRKEFNQMEHVPDEQKLVIINKDDKRIALAVDSVVGEHQAVLKPLGDIFAGQEYLSGGSIMGDGSVSLVLDTNKLALRTNLKNV